MVRKLFLLSHTYTLLVCFWRTHTHTLPKLIECVISNNKLCTYRKYIGTWRTLWVRLWRCCCRLSIHTHTRINFCWSQQWAVAVVVVARVIVLVRVHAPGVAAVDVFSFHWDVDALYAALNSICVETFCNKICTVFSSRRHTHDSCASAWCFALNTTCRILGTENFDHFFAPVTLPDWVDEPSRSTVRRDHRLAYQSCSNLSKALEKERNKEINNYVTYIEIYFAL